MHNLNLNALKMFDAAARHQNFRLAADELNLTQGAVAQQIRALEAQLGRKLFHRLPRGVALTEAGRKYHQDIKRALDIIGQATDRLLDAEVITLSVTPSLASKWLMPILPKLIENNPKIDIKLHATEQKSDLLRGDAAIAIRQGPPPQEPSLFARLLAPTKFIAVAKPGFGTPTQSIEDLLSYPLVQDGHGHWSKLCADFNLTLPRSILNVNQTALALDAAAAGQGIALSPSLLAQSELAAGGLQTLWTDSRPSKEGFHILYPKETATEHMRQVANWLAAQVTI